MDVHNEIGTGLKISLLLFVLILVGTLLYFVVRQNDELGLIYSSQDLDAIITRQNLIVPKTVDNPTPAP